MASESNPNCHHLSQNRKDVIVQSGCSGIPLLLTLVLMLLMNLRNQAQDYWYLKTSNNLIFIMSHLSQILKLKQKKDSVLLILRTGNFKTAKHLLIITVTTVCYRHTVALDNQNTLLHPLGKGIYKLFYMYVW